MGGQSGLLADAHRDGKRFVVHAEELLTAFLELESATHRRQAQHGPGARPITCDDPGALLPAMFVADAHRGDEKRCLEKERERKCASARAPLMKD